MINILVGTVTGTALTVANEIESLLHQHGEGARVVRMDDLRSDMLARGGVFVVCTSTTGKGDVPGNAAALLESLRCDGPDLSGAFYGLVGLGDSKYKRTFCHGPLKFDELLTQLGATRIGDALLHDASSGEFPEDVAVDWTVKWIADVREAFASIE